MFPPLVPSISHLSPLLLYHISVKLGIQNGHSDTEFFSLLLSIFHIIHKITIATNFIFLHQFPQVRIGRRTHKIDGLRVVNPHAPEKLKSPAKQQHADRSVVEVASIPRVARVRHISTPINLSAGNHSSITPHSRSSQFSMRSRFT